MPRSTITALTPSRRIDGTTVDISVVVTLNNNLDTLEELHRRTVGVLGELGRPFELIFVDDGSTDESFATLERLHAADKHVRAVRFKRGFGQQPAMHAGLARARGAIVVTIGGSLEYAPEQIPPLVAAVERGYDVASGRRCGHQDSWGTTLASHLINRMLRRFTGVAISDFGCTINAYRRDAVTPMLGAIGREAFTKALVLSGGASVVEVDITHDGSTRGSRHSPSHPMHLVVQTLAGFWPSPIQLIGIWLGALCTLAAAAVGAYGIFYWVDHADFPGPTLAGGAVLAVLGIQGFILALIGEYLGRVQRDVEGRPLYTIDNELG